jgi:RNA recognition motif-containing protein
MNIYVGNLSRDTAEGEIRQAFEGFGAVSSINIIKDKFTGDSRGFGFIEMPNSTEAEAAISGLNGKEMNGRELNVNQARPRAEGAGSMGGGGGRMSNGPRNRW